MPSDAREKILDAPHAVLRQRSIAAATTKQIAREAGYSEATLYKHFADKQEIFIRTLAERIPWFGPVDQLVGVGTVRANLEQIMEQLIVFYVQTFPIAVSIFGSPALLAEHRKGVEARGGGPQKPVAELCAYLTAEAQAGRLASTFDAQAAARLLAGAAFQQAFFTRFEGRETVPRVHAMAGDLVTVVLGRSAAEDA